MRISSPPFKFPCFYGIDISTRSELMAANHTVEDKIIIMGMSAGGHLAASLGVKWNSDELKQMGYKPEEIKPNGLVLSYPVITTNKDFWHQGSFEQILGKDGIEDEKALANQSLEKLVTKDVPPVFMWHTFEDKAVPMENSLLFASALSLTNFTLWANCSKATGYLTWQV